MSARDELAEVIANHFEVEVTGEYDACAIWATPAEVADAIQSAGYSKPRTITTPKELEDLPFGSAVQTSDESDTVVLKDKGAVFRNQSGCDLSATDLWRYGTHPLTLIYNPKESK